MNPAGTVGYFADFANAETVDPVTGLPSAIGLSGPGQFGGNVEVALSADGQSLFANGSDSYGQFVARLSLPSLTTMQEYRLPPPPSLGPFGVYLEVTGLAVAPDGSKIYVPVEVYAVADIRGYALLSPPDLTPGQIAIYNLATGGQTGVYSLPSTNAVNGALALSPDGSLLAAFYTSAEPFEPAAITVFSTLTGLPAGVIATPAGPNAFAFSPDGTLGIAGTDNGYALVDMSSFQVTSSVAVPGGVNKIAVSQE